MIYCTHPPSLAVHLTGAWGVGLATKKCDLNKIPLGNNSESWVLRSDGTVAHNGIVRHRLREVPEEGDMIVSAYRIYLINRPGCLLNFWTLRVGAYSSWALIKFSTISSSVVCLFCNKTINSENKTRRCNKARFL